MDTVEQQVMDRLQSAYLSVWGDKPPPETGTIVDPMENAAYHGLLRAAMKDSIVLIARHVDVIVAALDKASEDGGE